MRYVVRIALLSACLLTMASSSPAAVKPGSASAVAAVTAGPAMLQASTVQAPVRVGGAVREPKRLKFVAPMYPADARAAGVSGIVIVEARIDMDGRVVDARVLRGHEMLNEAALSAVRQWEYVPTLLNGAAVPVVMTVTVNFTLDKSASSPSSAIPTFPTLTGTWQSDDGGVYQIRTSGKDIFWIGTYPSATSANVFHGTWSSGSSFTGRWAEVPPSAGRKDGYVTVRMVDDRTLQLSAAGDFPARSFRKLE